MGLLESLGLRAKAPKAPAKPKRKRRTKAQIHSEEIKALREEREFLQEKAALDRLKHRIKNNGYGEDDEDQSWTDVIKDVAPGLLKVVLGNLGGLQQQAASASAEGEAPAQLPQQASQSGDVPMDQYSTAILANVRGKSPEEAAAWFRHSASRDPIMGKAVIGRLVKTPENGLNALLDQYQDFAPGFVAYCRQNPEWFIKTVRCLKPPTPMAPVDPLAAAL